MSKVSVILVSDRIFALVDCNNFFASCERLFRPELAHKPVVVLSSNDGCVVARSNEAKALGIPMGAPAFKYRQLFKDKQVAQFSGNFELYGDISKRITALLTTITPRIEIYSVDESFLDLTRLHITDYAAWGRMVREFIWKHVGMAVSIGIAPSKTLAKLASEIAKKDEQYCGAVSFVDMDDTERYACLEATPVKDVWGVGRQLAPMLRSNGIGNALALSRISPRLAQQLMGINGRQLVAELNGVNCHALEPVQSKPQSIMRGRTFGEYTGQAHVLEAAVATLSAQGAFALRQSNQLARKIGLFTNTNRHKPGYRKWVREIKLAQPTNDTGRIISLIAQELHAIYNPAQAYHRLGIFLGDFVPADSLQTDLLGEVNTVTYDREQARMQALDAINRKHGKGRIYYAAQDLSNTWQPKHNIRSPRYVSNWDELPEARIT